MDDDISSMKDIEDRTPAVRLKGVGDSIWVTLDPTRTVADLKQGLEALFRRMQHLAVNARVIIDAGTENDYEALVKEIAGFLKENFSVGTVSMPPREPMSRVEKDRRRDMADAWHYRRSDVLMLAGRVRSGQQVTARKHLIILGDVNPGAEIAAGGDILVLGNLSGKVVAGQPDDLSAIVLALKFKPTQVQIGSVVAVGAPATEGATAEFAHVENNCIVVDNYLTANPFGSLPWPEVR